MIGKLRPLCLLGLIWLAAPTSGTAAPPMGGVVAGGNAALWAPTTLWAQAAAEQPAQEEQPLGSLILQYFPLIILPILFMLMVSRPQQQAAKEQEERLGRLKKNSRVVTRGGIYGTVYSVDREQNRVTLKVDEATNTKIEVTLNSIETVLEEPAATDAKS
ncbi:MAG: preprotein translocase subunit YajC [Pirellulales bacterium]|nr:preprotein translocase subunit YajC [Pirellulales bacterium]